MPWSGVHASVEYLTTTSSQFNGTIQLFDRSNMMTNPPNVGFGISLGRDASWTGQHANHARLRLMEWDLSASSLWTLYDTYFDLANMPIDEWVRLSFWHDPIADLVMGEVRLVSDGSLVVSSSFTPTIIDTPEPIAWVLTGGQEQEWQYLDNVSITPEPATLSLLALGGMALRRRWR